jgi:hypothetical protein
VYVHRMHLLQRIYLMKIGLSSRTRGICAPWPAPSSVRVVQRTIAGDSGDKATMRRSYNSLAFPHVPSDPQRTFVIFTDGRFALYCFLPIAGEVYSRHGRRAPTKVL